MSTAEQRSVLYGLKKNLNASYNKNYYLVANLPNIYRDLTCVIVMMYCQSVELHGDVCVCMFSSHSFILQKYQPGSHRRKVTQDFSSTFFLRCVP